MQSTRPRSQHVCVNMAILVFILSLCDVLMSAFFAADGGHVALLRAGQGPLVLQVRRVAGRGVHNILEVSPSVV